MVRLRDGRYRRPPKRFFLGSGSGLSLLFECRAKRFINIHHPSNKQGYADKVITTETLWSILMSGYPRPCFGIIPNMRYCAPLPHFIAFLGLHVR